MNGTQDHGANILLACCLWRTNRVMEHLRRQERLEVEESVKLRVGDWIFVACGQSLSSNFRWPGPTSKYYGPCRIIKTKHCLYEFVYLHGRQTRLPIHFSRLKI